MILDSELTIKRFLAAQNVGLIELPVNIHGQRQGLVPVCGHTVIAYFSASPDGGHTGTEVS